MEKVLNYINEERAALFTRFALALMFLWFGAMNFTAVGQGTVASWLSVHMLFSNMTDGAIPIASAVGVLQILIGLAIAAGSSLMAGRVFRVGAAAAAVFALYSLTLLVLANVWIDSMGGFPVIGAGQGIIKYLAIFGVALYLAARDDKTRNRAFVAILAGLILVLGWIGAMKFTAIEAGEIKPLLETSPFFFWMLLVYGEQGASNFIGIVEIITAILLTGWFWNRTAFIIGALLCVATLLSTLSFMVSFPGWEQNLGGFPALSSTGHFLLKDLVMLAGTFVLIANRKPA